MKLFKYQDAEEGAMLERAIISTGKMHAIKNGRFFVFCWPLPSWGWSFDMITARYKLGWKWTVFCWVWGRLNTRRYIDYSIYELFQEGPPETREEITLADIKTGKAARPAI